MQLKMKDTSKKVLNNMNKEKNKSLNQYLLIRVIRHNYYIPILSTIIIIEIKCATN